MDSIFIQIASYRDTELLSTIKDCLNNAKYPERLYFGICLQHGDETSQNDINFLEKLQNTKFLKFDYTESKGACWARNKILTLYNNEKYSLQIDSHMRFIKNWDEEIINVWNSTNDEKAIITGYPPNYFPDKPEQTRHNIPQVCNVYKFDHKYVMARPMNMDDFNNKTSPVKGVYISAGFIFGLGEILTKVPYDPDFYFSGEECAMAIRYFTHGYNLYCSHKIITYHYYQRLECKKHWSDHTDWPEYHKIAHDRLDCLLGRNQLFDLGIYGLGNVRTLEDYRIYSGIDFEKKIIHKDTANGLAPPCSNSEEGWDNEIVEFTGNVAWDFEKIEKCDDVIFWAMIFLDQDGIAIYREDLLYENNKEFIDGEKTSKYFKFDRSKNRQIITQLLIWPYSKSKHWIESSYQPFKIL
jgi:hypothetical protein